MKIEAKEIRGYVRERTVTLSLRVKNIEKLPKKFTADIVLSRIRKA